VPTPLSQYSLIAERWPQLHEEAVRVEHYALSDPRTACFYANDSLLQRPWGEHSLSQLIHAFDFSQFVGPHLWP
jgi:type I restriction enzyme R subunit